MSVKSYQDRVRSIGCVLCKAVGLTDPELRLYLGPIELHHVESIRDGLSEYAVVPLHKECHQGANGVHGLGRRGFVARYKLTDVDLLALVAKALA